MMHWVVRLIFVALTVGCNAVLAGDSSKRASHEVLAFYYGWYGTPGVSGEWVHWMNTNPSNLSIGNTEDYPAVGAYDSHDADLVAAQISAARASGVTGFISSWAGQNTFEDQSMDLLLRAASGKHFAISAYFENLKSSDALGRVQEAIADIGYLLTRYGSNPAWLRVDSKPVIFFYTRALHLLSPTEWEAVFRTVRIQNPEGLVAIADSQESDYISVFDGASVYNITASTQKMTPDEIRVWAHKNYPRMVETAGPGKISSVTVIPGYDDRAAGRPLPRPVTPRWGTQTYKNLWEEAILAKPTYVLITSWNEWHEGTEIEASVEYGDLFEKCTVGFSRAFLGLRQ